MNERPLTAKDVEDLAQIMYSEFYSGDMPHEGEVPPDLGMDKINWVTGIRKVLARLNIQVEETSR